MVRRRVLTNGGGIILGAILLIVGGYYFLRNTLGWDLGQIDTEAAWPILVIALGGWLVVRDLGSRTGTDGPASE
jgi:hypothetical protein